MAEDNRRRSHGGGTITKRGKNSWRIRYDLPRDSSGRRQRATETVKGTRKQAERVLRDRIIASENGGYVPRTRETVGQFLDRWLDMYCASNVSARTLQGYRSKLTTYVKPAFGAVELQKLLPQHIQAMYADLVERGLSPRTVLQTHRIVYEALGHAVKWGILPRNPAAATSPPRATSRDHQMWNEADVIRFLKAAEGSRYENLYKLLVLTGLRRSEAAGLKWSNIDLEAKALRVVTTLQYIHGQGLVEGVPKTHRSRRSVSLSDATVDLLRHIRGKQLEDRLEVGEGWHNERDHVFTQKCGCPIHPDEATREFTEIVQNAGLPKLTLHGLRHAHATLLLAQGVHPKVVSERLGHASVTITLDTYSHVLPTLQSDAAALVDGVLTSARSS